MPLILRTEYFLAFILSILIYSCQNGSIAEANHETLDEVIEAIPVDTVPKSEKDSNGYDILVSFRDIPGYQQPTLDKSKYEEEDGHLVLEWQHLSRIVFEDKRVSDTLLLMFPIFHDDIKALDGQKVQIKGYVIPLGEETGKLHFLSAYPMSQCFFCGGAGPESVMDVQTHKIHKEFKMDDILTFRGTLQLNDTNLDYMNYILKDATLIKK